MFYRGERTRPAAIMGTSERFVDVNFAKLARRPRLHRAGGAAAQARRGDRLRTVRRRCSRRGASIRSGSSIRIGALDYTVRRRHRQAAGRGRLQPRPGRLRDHSLHRVPQAVRQRTRAASGPFGGQAVMIAVVPRDDVHSRGRDARGRGGHAHPPRPDARQAQRLRPRHPGRRAQGVGADLPGRAAVAGRDLVHRADGRRHRRDGDHDHLGDRTDPRDRRPQGASAPGASRSSPSS